MTKNHLGGIFAALLIALLIPALAVADESAVYGEGVDLDESTLISVILETPDEYVGETVRVEGMIVGVCKKRGCWMEIGGDEEFQSMRIKVEDGVIVFPYESKGMYAVAEGELVRIDLSMEQTCAMAEAECEAQGKTFDKSTVTEPGVVYMIMGTGAVISETPSEEALDPDAEQS
jgi:hypothetical protein